MSVGSPAVQELHCTLQRIHVHLGVDKRRADIGVAEEATHRVDVYPLADQIRGKGVAQGTVASILAGLFPRLVRPESVNNLI